MQDTLGNIIDGLNEKIAERLRITLELVQAQSIGAESYRQDAKVWTKDDNTPVSISDLLHQTQLQDVLAKNFPEDGLIAEEPRSLQEEAFSEATVISSEHYDYHLSKKLHHIPDTGEFTWVYDPIDGTKGYLKGRYYAVALGCFHENEPVIGIMSVPHKGKGDERMRIDGAIAFAVPGRGAWMKSVDTPLEGPWDRLDANQFTNSQPAMVGMSLEHGGGLAETFEENDMLRVKIDSQAKYLAVAAGELDAYVRQSRTDRPEDLLWDHLPGIMIAREAGATVESFDGSSINVERQKEVLFVGGMKCFRGDSNAAFPQKLAKILKEKVAS